MIRLSRETRFALVATGNGSFKRGDADSKNGWAGWPATDLVVPQLKLRLIVAGAPDPKTGYLCNIKIIDQLFRQIVLQNLIPANDPPIFAQTMLELVWQQVQLRWPELIVSEKAFAAQPTPYIESLVLHLSPFLKHSVVADPTTHTNQENTMSSDHDQRNIMPLSTITQQFEFSAAHRLHCDHLSDEQNQTMFGKCNNPAGHGHNYVVEVCVSGDGQSLALSAIESIVQQRVISVLDHKHLNEDVDHFVNVNPTVENIAAVIFDWLDNQFDRATLQSIRVFETPKTWAERRRSCEAST